MLILKSNQLNPLREFSEVRKRILYSVLRTQNKKLLYILNKLQTANLFRKISQVNENIPKCVGKIFKS